MQKASCAKQSLANEVLTELPIPAQPSLMLVLRARLSPGESLARKTRNTCNTWIYAILKQKSYNFATNTLKLI